MLPHLIDFNINARFLTFNMNILMRNVYKTNETQILSVSTIDLNYFKSTNTRYTTLIS